MAWNKLKSMFVVSDTPAQSTDDVLKDLEKYQLPEGEVGTLPDGTAPAMISGTIDFQALYDQAGIPNTDEVEALERFLTGLDESLPAASKVAAARAFLGAIGKAAKDVITDAGRKITVVRAVVEAKRADGERAVSEREAVIADLQRQVDEQRAAIQELQRDVEGARSQCAVEESRLQGARVFFGHMTDVAAESAQPPRAR